MVDQHFMMDTMNDSETLSQFFESNELGLDYEQVNGSDFFDSLSDQLPTFTVDDITGITDWNTQQSQPATVLPVATQQTVAMGYQGQHQQQQLVLGQQAVNVAAITNNPSAQRTVLHNGFASNTSSSNAQQPVAGSSPLIIRNGPMVAGTQLSNTVQIIGSLPTGGTKLLMDTGQSAGGNAVRLQYVTAQGGGISLGGVAAPTQTLHIVQQQPLQQQQQYQQVQFIQQQQQPTQQAVTIVQGANGQFYLQPQQQQQQQQRIIAQRPAQQQQQMNIMTSGGQIVAGSPQQRFSSGAVQVPGGSLQQQFVLQQPQQQQQQQNIVLQTLPVAGSNATCVSTSNLIQMNQLSGGIMQQTLASNQLPTASALEPTNSMLVQIDGQTYRMQNVQQLPTVGTNIQLAASPRPPPAQPTPAQPMGAAQTITLTRAQLAQLQQTPPNKQLAVLQQMQRQQQLSVSSPAGGTTLQIIGNAGATAASVGTGAMIQSTIVSSTAATQPTVIRLPILKDNAATPTRVITLPGTMGALRTSLSATPPPAVAVLPPGASPSTVLHNIRPKPGTAGGSMSMTRTSTPLHVNMTIQPAPNTANRSSLQAPVVTTVTAQPTATTLKPANPLEGSTVRLLQVNSSQRPTQPISGATIAHYGNNTSVMTMVTAVTPQTSTTASTLTAVSESPIQLTQQQQTLLVRVQNQLRVLTSNTQRTPEQDRFLTMLHSAQQQIRAQGRAQYQAAQRAIGGAVSAAQPVTVTTTSTPRFVTMGTVGTTPLMVASSAQRTIGSTVYNVATPLQVSTVRSSAGPTLLPVVMSSSVSASHSNLLTAASVGSPLIKLAATSLTSGVSVSVLPMVSSASSSAGGPTAVRALVLPAVSAGSVPTSTVSATAGGSGVVTTIEQLYKSFPHLREKLEAQLAKMPAEKRDWFLKNQTAIFSKLQQHQQQLLQQRAATAAATGVTSSAAPVQPATGSATSVADIRPSIIRLPVSIAPNIVVNGSTLTIPPRFINSLALRGTRKQRFQLQLCKEQKHAAEPDYKTPFSGQKDILRRLSVFHVFQTRDDDPEQIELAEAAYEEQARQLLERKDTMLTKYRRLLLQDAVRPESTANDVMLGRMFLSDERLVLKEDMRLAAEDPDSFVPRPVLQPTKDEPKSSVDEDLKCDDPDTSAECIEIKDESSSDELTDVKPEIKSEKLDVKSAASPSYTVHSSGRLTFVFKSSPLHSRSPARSPPPLKDVRVKLERCDSTEKSDVAAAPSSPKRCRLDSAGFSPQDSGFSPQPGESGLSEDDAAVAGLLAESVAVTSDDYDTKSSVRTAADYLTYNGSDVVDYTATPADFFEVGENVEYISMEGATADEEEFMESSAAVENLFSGYGSSGGGIVSSCYKTAMNSGFVDSHSYVSSAPTNGCHSNVDDSSLQPDQEMQFAIDSILGLQQLDGPIVTATMTTRSSSPRCAAPPVDRDADDLDAAIRSILY